VALIIGREMAVTTLRGLAGAEGVVIAASRLGKTKNLSQLAATTLLILHYPYFSIDVHLLGTILIWIALVMTMWSGIDYFVRYLRSV
jgi:CDP-diacylglycerol--glycerol-3-phosphate 3-phosphatidyltransferase